MERSPEADNFSDDDEETLSSEPDLGSDVPQVIASILDVIDLVFKYQLLP